MGFWWGWGGVGVGLGWLPTQECAALMAELGDIFLAFPGAESDAADVLNAARERGAVAPAKLRRFSFR